MLRHRKVEVTRDCPWHGQWELPSVVGSREWEHGHFYVLSIVWEFYNKVHSHITIITN